MIKNKVTFHSECMLDLKLADLLFSQESKSLDNNKLPNACIRQEILLP